MDKPHSEAIRRLQEIAEEDLRVARACLELRPSAVRMAAYHSQQAAEKHLKAWLVALGELDYPLTHNLLNLADLLAERGGPRLPAEPLRFLTRFAITPRYEVAHLTQDDAEDAVAEAEQIVDPSVHSAAPTPAQPHPSVHSIPRADAADRGGMTPTHAAATPGPVHVVRALVGSAPASGPPVRPAILRWTGWPAAPPQGVIQPSPRSR